jgi:hypothetical protein
MASSISSESTRLENAQANTARAPSVRSQKSGKAEVDSDQKIEVDNQDVERQGKATAPAIGRNAAILLFIG